MNERNFPPLLIAVYSNFSDMVYIMVLTGEEGDQYLADIFALHKYIVPLGDVPEEWLERLSKLEAKLVGGSAIRLRQFINMARVRRISAQCVEEESE